MRQRGSSILRIFVRRKSYTRKMLTYIARKYVVQTSKDYYCL